MTFEEQLKTSGKLVFTNKGVSMMPLIRADQDVLVIEACEACEVRKLDAVLFVRYDNGKKNYVLHRVLRINPDGTFWVVGDNCVGGDTVRPQDILGKLTGIKRNGKLINVTDKNYLRYVHLWCDFYQVRFFLLRVKSFISRALRFIKRRLIHEK